MQLKGLPGSKRQYINSGGGLLDGLRAGVASFVRSIAPIEYDYPDPSRVLGIDVHQYSGVVDWEAAKAGGIKFALIKATNGLAESPYFRENWEGARKAGMLRGAWGWLYPASCISPGAQARKMLSLLGDDIGELCPCIDYEWTRWNGKPANPEESDLYGMAKPIEDAIGRKPMVYSSPGYLIEKPLHSSYWHDVDLWIANYKVMSPMVQAPFKVWTFWQFTDAGFGELYGVDKYMERAVDLNYFNGTLDELYLYAGGEIVAPPPTGGSMWKKVNTAVLNIRRGPAANYQDVGDLLRNDVVEIVESAAGGWGRIGSWYRAGAIKTLPDALNSWCQTAYLVDTTSPIVPPVEPPTEDPDYITAHYADGTEKKYVPE